MVLAQLVKKASQFERVEGNEWGGGDLIDSAPQFPSAEHPPHPNVLLSAPDPNVLRRTAAKPGMVISTDSIIRWASEIMVIMSCTHSAVAITNPHFTHCMSHHILVNQC